MSAMYCGTSITERPTVIGEAGQAWRVRMQPLGQRGLPDWDGTIDMFMVWVAAAHPLWNHWLVSVIHLRPIPGVKPAHIRRPGATHELLIVALDPEKPLPSLDVDPNWKPNYLTPIDVVEQFAVRDDVVAAQILHLAVSAIVDGIASPDQDWRAWWANAVTRTAGHYNDGTHSTGSRS